MRRPTSSCCPGPTPRSGWPPWPRAHSWATTGRCTSWARRSTSTGCGATSSRWRATCGSGPPHRLEDVDQALLASGLARLFDGTEVPDLQRMAAAVAVLRSVSVVAGGPGTGKTTTVARVLALLDEQAVRGGPSASADRAGRADRQGGGPAGGSGAGRRGNDGGRRRGAGAPGRPDRRDPAPAPRLQPRQPDPLPAQPAEPAAPRRGRGRRDLHGLALDDGPAGRGGAARGPAHPGRRPRAAGLGGGGRRPGRHRRPGLSGASAWARPPGGELAAVTGQPVPANAARTPHRWATASSCCAGCIATAAPSPSWPRPFSGGTPMPCSLSSGAAIRTWNGSPSMPPSRRRSRRCAVCAAWPSTAAGQ